MPRDGKSSLIQRIANKAKATFKNCAPADSKAFAAQRSELSALLSELRAADLSISPPKRSSSSSAGPGSSAPVTYMHICETDAFSMGVFLLRRGASIPLHDHPGMNGMLKVLYGKVRIRCFDKLERPQNASEAGGGGPSPPQSLSPSQSQMSSQQAPVWLSVLRSTGEFTEHSGPCLLTPLRENLHQIEAVEGPAAFLDILAPPYDPDEGRDCHYYRVIHAVGGEAGQNSKEETWLLEIPQPDDFWCGGEPYPGPQVAL
ncbi:2-aminoethanethiol (cysteamine) dioxygenase a [Pygocentrus nattereri]|uniref:2-aminoethanethiol (cysteamine) dioxygenase a n=1 Tax=Pygocentrus nattereri TaxID=42514 RepID=A0A3B4E924_PYGNA|nr:2-aminoethanethiol (cysteamine) dioxygenase a [Pygocentrus nattereri]